MLLDLFDELLADALGRLFIRVQAAFLAAAVRVVDLAVPALAAGLSQNFSADVKLLLVA